jgi:hypothetical protein
MKYLRCESELVAIELVAIELVAIELVKAYKAAGKNAYYLTLRHDGYEIRVW